MKKRGEENQGDKVEDLSSHDAIEKLKELIKHNSICMFATRLADTPLETRPMSVAQVDDEGNLWFLSGKSTKKNEDIAIDSHVQLFFSNVSDQEYLSVYGMASIVNNKPKIKELWTPIAKAWFNEGVDDPDISAIKLEPENAFYWDTKSGRMISLIKILASAVTGKTLQEGVRGKLTV
ncbi:MAG TPA: pyridoxamine 5'-phosphate oxidase family protein [Cyclobacteriaceae bacterium]|nr:pyridoxamine 5'-phosphate oxidase family protein [Cyclobacteriaceae bacterium]